LRLGEGKRGRRRKDVGTAMQKEKAQSTAFDQNLLRKGGKREALKLLGGEKVRAPLFTLNHLLTEGEEEN